MGLEIEIISDKKATYRGDFEAYLALSTQKKRNTVTEITFVGHSSVCRQTSNASGNGAFLSELGLYLKGENSVQWRYGSSPEDVLDVGDFFSKKNFPHLRTINLKGCNTAGGHSNPRLRARDLEYLRADKTPVNSITWPEATQKNIANGFAKAVRGVTVNGAEGLYMRGRGGWGDIWTNREYYYAPRTR